MGMDLSNRQNQYQGVKEMTRQELNQPSADSKDLGPLAAGPFQIGAVDEVNGEGGVEAPDFAPTRHELLQLVRYWVQKSLEIDYFFFLYGISGSDEIRVEPHAWRRVHRIAEVLGKKAVQKAVDEAREMFGRNQDPRLWHIFVHGSEEEWDAVAEEIASAA